jgi:transcriptional regulator with XRE-family HTH domain
VNDTQTESRLTPKHLAKEEFGRRLYRLMLERGWNQSETGRRAGLARDKISVYVTGKALPTPANAKALADTFGISLDELLPNMAEAAIDSDNPSFEMKVSVGAPNTAWLRVNRLVSMATAVKIAELLQHDEVLNRAGSGTNAPLQQVEGKKAAS